jgi:uncharacterized membrane protein YdjX (TVP38/TMEM64 family)
MLLHLKDLIITWCSSNPYVLFAALVVLPGFGFPASILLVLAGVVWGGSAKTCAIALFALVLNLIWTRWLAAGPGKKIISRLLGDRWTRLENMPRADLFRLTCILRVTPGLPLFLQNYILGLLGVPLRPYLMISTPLLGLWTVGFVITGGAIFQGRAGIAITGVSILVAAALILRLIRSKIGKPKGDQEAA